MMEVLLTATKASRPRKRERTEKKLIRNKSVLSSFLYICSLSMLLRSTFEPLFSSVFTLNTCLRTTSVWSCELPYGNAARIQRPLIHCQWICIVKNVTSRHCIIVSCILHGIDQNQKKVGSTIPRFFRCRISFIIIVIIIMAEKCVSVLFFFSLFVFSIFFAIFSVCKFMAVFVCVCAHARS